MKFLRYERAKCAAPKQLLSNALSGVVMEGAVVASESIKSAVVLLEWNRLF